MYTHTYNIHMFACTVHMNTHTHVHSHTAAAGSAWWHIGPGDYGFAVLHGRGFCRPTGALVQGPVCFMSRVGQNRMYIPYMTVCMMITLLNIPYIHPIYIYMYGSGQPYS
jgi:hypothetical protein